MIPGIDLSLLSVTQVRILELLSDGKRHAPLEIHEASTKLNDDLARPASIRNHITAIRKVIQPKGYDILCAKGWRTGYLYRLVMLISNDDS